MKEITYYTLFVQEPYSCEDSECLYTEPLETDFKFSTKEAAIKAAEYLTAISDSTKYTAVKQIKHLWDNIEDAKEHPYIRRILKEYEKN